DFWMPPMKELKYFNLSKPRRRIARKMLADATEDLDRLNTRRHRDFRRPIVADDLTFLSDFEELPIDSIDMDRYTALFDRKKGLLSGDVTPAYSALRPAMVDRIVGQFGDAKYVFIARDPVKRFWSQVRMHVYKQRLSDGLDEKAVVKLLSQRRYDARSFSSQIVETWKSRVRPGHFGLFFFDDLVSNPVGFRQEIISFLGGDPDKPTERIAPDFNRKNGKSSAPMPDLVRDLVAAKFAGELRACAEKLGGPAKEWRKLYGV
ncbi:MAG: sulfotransferase, partial [Bauldia sp.]|nr:sulfotransferase [Bauldia sp.]